MMNVTSRLAIRIRYIPDFEFSWSDITPRRSCHSITIEDVSPSQRDARVLKQHSIQFLMEFLVKMFSNLHDLEEFVPVVEPIHPVQKSEVVPMKLLLKDRKYKSETIDILTQLYSDVALTGDHQASITQLATLLTQLNQHYAYPNNYTCTCMYIHVHAMTRLSSFVDSGRGSANM